MSHYKLLSHSLKETWKYLQFVCRKKKKEYFTVHVLCSLVKYFNYHLYIFHMTTVHLCGNARQFVLHAVVFSKVWLNIYTYEFPRQTIYNALKGINQNAGIQAIWSGNSKHSLLLNRLCVQQVSMVIYPGKKRDEFVIQETLTLKAFTHKARCKKMT